MGSGFRCICKKCHKKIEVFEGKGMLDFEEELIDINGKFNLLSRYVNGIDKEKLERYLNDKDFILKNDYGRRIFQCPKCKEISSCFYFELEGTSKYKDSFVSKYLCKNCKEILNQIGSLNNCPYCGEKLNSDEIEYINWD